MHPRHLFRRTDAKLIYHPTGTDFFGDGSLNTAAGKQLLCHLCGQGLLGLQHQPLCIKILGKAGKAIGRRANTAILLQAAPRDFFPRLGRKTHIVLSFSVL